MLDFLETLAHQVALAIDNIELLTNLQQANVALARSYDATLEGWVGFLDLRDKETEGHTRRVTEMTVRLARHMALPEERIEHVRRGALLHDIGKMGIPDAVLLKPGPLDDEEWSIMRRHPVYAFDLLAPIEYLRPALDIPHCHHEKWDGSGYPRGSTRRPDPAGGAHLRGRGCLGCAALGPSLPGGMVGRASSRAYSRSVGDTFRSAGCRALPEHGAHELRQ